MIVDTSAIVAILRGEPDADVYTSALAGATRPPRMSVGTYVEAAIVVDANHDPVLSSRFEALLGAAGIEVEPVSKEQGLLARRAYQEFGKGSGHPAQLDFGDCFAYALARATGEPLLFKGDDFSHTDLDPVVSRS